MWFLFQIFNQKYFFLSTNDIGNVAFNVLSFFLSRKTLGLVVLFVLFMIIYDVVVRVNTFCKEKFFSSACWQLVWSIS